MDLHPYDIVCHDTTRHDICMFFVGTNIREMMNVSRIYGVVVWHLMCDDFGDLEMMNVQCVPS
jgi:hypothetical protein